MIMSPELWVSVPATAKFDPSVTVPADVLLSVKLLMVVLPVVANVPKLPVPLITKLEPLITFKKLSFGVKMSLKVKI